MVSVDIGDHLRNGPTPNLPDNFPVNRPAAGLRLLRKRVKGAKVRLHSARSANGFRVVIGATVLALLASGCGVVRVSVSSTGAEGNQDSWSTRGVTDDGRYSLFDSSATNLVPNDTNGLTDVFRHDTTTGGTVRVDVSPNGGQLPAGGFGGAMSADGRYGAFVTAASLDLADTNGTTDVYVRDLTIGTTTWASPPPAAGFPTGGGVSYVAISADGRYVSFFWERATSTPELRADTLYRRDRQTATTTKLHDEGTFGGFHVSSDALHYVLETSCIHACIPRPVVVDVDGSANGWPALPFGSCGFEFVDAISATGRFLAWHSAGGQPAPCLAGGEYVVDRATAGVTPIGNLSARGISRDSKTLLVLADGTLTPGGTAGRSDLYLHDVPSGTNTRFVSSTSGGDQNADILDAVLSDDAHEIGFATAADDLVAGDANGVRDVFVRPGLARATSP
jgi:hypothetical protein